MDTLEEMYASLMVGGTDKVQAARVDATGAEGSLEDMYAQRVREYDDVLAANPYGCNQYGHEWRGKHGEGWKPRGSRGEEKQGEKKTETPEERTKRVVVGAVKDANHALEELNKQLGKPPYDINDPRARAKVNLEHELTRTKERDTEEAAERLQEATERAKKTLGGEKTEKNKGQENKEWKSPHRNSDGSFNIPALEKPIAIPTRMPTPKDMSEREILIENTKYKPEWIVRTDVRKEADKALNALKERMKKEKTGSESWVKYKTHENSLNGFVSRMLNSATERQRREQMRFMLQYLQHVEKDLKEK